MNANVNLTDAIRKGIITFEQAVELSGMATVVAMEEKPVQPKKTAQTAKSEKPREKCAQIRAKHDKILDSKRIERMVDTAVKSAHKQGFDCKTSKQGKWVWLYPVDGRGRTPEFKSVKLAKGWKYSPKRGAFYRDFS